jgi:hypothetical protein
MGFESEQCFVNVNPAEACDVLLEEEIVLSGRVENSEV